MTHPTALTVVNPDAMAVDFSAPRLINIEARLAEQANLKDYISKMLVDGTHFGKMPGVDKSFLWQAGAEKLLLGFEARCEYSTEAETIDWDNLRCFYRVKCMVVSLSTGTKLGEAEATANHLETASGCQIAQPRQKAGTRDGNGRFEEDPADVFFECPEHGRDIARSWWDREKRVRMLACAHKVLTEGSFANVIQRTYAMAQKRAMVSAVRTVGAVSEMFTQDEDGVQQGGGSRPAPAQNRQAPAQPKPKQERPPVADRVADATGGRATPATTPTPPATPPTNAAPVTLDEVKAAMKKAKDNGVTPGDVNNFFENEGGGPYADYQTGLKEIRSWCEYKAATADFWADSVIEYKLGLVEKATSEGATVVEGVVVPDPDDLPFE